jgi:hypothetical protein
MVTTAAPDGTAILAGSAISSARSWENAYYNDDGMADYNKRSTDNDMSGNTADTTRTERANTQTDESTKTRTRGVASAERKHP